MFKILFNEDGPAWARDRTTFSFDFGVEDVNGTPKNENFRFSFSPPDHPGDGQRFHADAEDHGAYSTFVHGLAVDRDKTVQVLVSRGGNDLAEFWLTKDEIKSSATTHVEISLELGARRRPSDFPPIDQRAAIFDETQQLVLFPILFGPSEKLEAKRSGIIVKLQGKEKPKITSRFVSAAQRESKDMDPLTLYYGQDTDTHDVGLFYRPETGDTYRAWPDPQATGNILLALGFHSSSLDKSDSPLEAFLLRREIPDVSEVRFQVITPADKSTIWGRLDNKSQGHWIAAEDALKELVVIKTEPSGGGERNVVQTLGNGASPIRIIDTFQTNLEARKNNTPKVTLFHPKDGNTVDGTFLPTPPKKGSEDVTQVTVSFDLRSGGTKKHDVEIMLHRFVKRTLMIAIDFGSHAWLATLFDHDPKGPSAPNRTEISIGPKINREHMSPVEGISEIVYQGNGTKTSFPSKGLEFERLQKRYGVERNAFRVLTGNTDAPDDIGRPTDALRKYYLPYFKSALYRGDESIHVPDGSGKARPLAIEDVFRQVFEQVLAEILENDAVRKRIIEVCLYLDKLDKKEEAVFGVLLTHPGFISFETHKRLIETIRSVLHKFYGLDLLAASGRTHLQDELGLKGNIAEHISLVRAIPEPVAAAMEDLANQETKWVACIDVGRRTLDIAVFEPSTGIGHAQQSASRKLVECWGTDLGGQRLDYAILQGLVELLTDNDPEKEYKHILPLDDLGLKEAFIAQKCDATRRTYRRFQTILRCIEEAKCEVDSLDGQMRMRVSRGQGNRSDHDWFGLYHMSHFRQAVENSSGLSLDDIEKETFLKVEMPALLNTRSIKRFQKAVQEFCKSYLFPNGRDERQNMHITVCGRAAQSIFLETTFKSLTRAGDLPQIAKGSVAKERVVNGAIKLMENPGVLLTDSVNLRLSLLELDADCRILKVHDCKEIELTLSNETQSITIAAICPNIAELMMQEIKDEPASKNWWYEATFLDNAIKNSSPIKGSSQVSLTESSDIDPAYRRKVTRWTVAVKDSGYEKTWHFMSHGALNQ